MLETMSETQESTELATELAVATVEHADGQPTWHRKVAFSSLLVAVLAAAAALLAGMTAHEVLIDRTEEILDVAYAQSDLERVDTIRTRHAVLQALGTDPSPDEVASADQLEAVASQALADAEVARAEASFAGSMHLVFAAASTIFAVAIAISGLAVIVDRAWLWGAGAAIALLGLVGLGIGLRGFLA